MALLGLSEEERRAIANDLRASADEIIRSTDQYPTWVEIREKRWLLEGKDDLESLIAQFEKAIPVPA